MLRAADHAGIALCYRDCKSGLPTWQCQVAFLFLVHAQPTLGGLAPLPPGPRRAPAAAAIEHWHSKAGASALLPSVPPAA